MRFPSLCALALALSLAGCSEPPAMTSDLAVPVDMAAPAGVTMRINGGPAMPLSAWYSIFIEPPEGFGSMPDTELAITLIDPAYQCTSAVTTSYDAISFGFQARAPGVSSSFIIGRGGPHLGPITDGSGWAQLDMVDDRYQGQADGGAPIVADGGLVTGLVHFQSSTIEIDGTFRAPHCAALDFAAAP